jgi:DNA-binding NarL/FixJ family response regulator
LGSLAPNTGFSLLSFQLVASLLVLLSRSKPFDPEELEVIVANCLERGSRGSLKGGNLEGGSQSVAALQTSINEIKDLLTTRPPSTPATAILTPKETVVLRGVSEGMMNKEIAREMEISVRSVEVS